MKKLIAMIGAVATAFGLYAATPYAISFESAEGCTQGEALNKTEWTVPEGSIATVVERTLDYKYQTSGDARRTDLFEETNLNSLKLETGAGKVVCTPGNVVDGIFFDQVVKFTGYEEPPTVTDGKIAVWMSAIEADDKAETPVVGETNMYITCGTVALGGAITAKTINLGAYNIDATHRVTIKSLGQVANGLEGAAIAGFIVYIDGVQVVSTEAEGIVNEAQILPGDASNYNASGMLFPALVAGDVATVAYQGIGELDDLVVDADGPEFTQFVEGTVALVDGATLVVTNALGEIVYDQAKAEGGKTFQIAPNSTLGFIYTAAEGKFLTGGVLGIAKDTSIAGQDKDFSDLADDIEAKDAVAKYDGDNVELYTDDLNEAFENTLGNVTLVANAVLTAPVDMAGFGGEFDLAGFTVSGTWATSYANPGAGRQYLFEIGSDADVTVYGGTITSTGKNIGAFHVVGGNLSLDDVTVNASWRAIGAYKGATVEVGKNAVLATSGEDPTIFIWSNFQDLENDEVQCDVTIAGKVSNTFAGPRTCANLDAVIMGSGNDKLAGVALTIADGAEIEGTACAGIYFPCAGELSIGAASITGTEGVYVKGGASTIVDGAEITATGTAGEFLANHNGHVWTGDAFVVDVSKGYAEVAEQSITGGKFESTFGVAVASYKEDGATADRVTGFIEGGLFKGAALPATDLIAAEEGHRGKWVEGEDGFYTPDTELIPESVAKIDDVEFETLQAAVAAAKATDTVELLADITLTEHVQVEKNLTVDLKGKTIKTTAGCRNAATAFNVDGAYTVNISNGSIDASEVDETQTVDKEVDVLLVRNGGTLNLEDVNVTMDSKNGACAYAFAGSYININGGAYNNKTLQDYEFKPGVKGMPLNQANVADQLIKVSAGSFRQYNPALGDDAGFCKTFLAAGKASVKDADGWYKVDTAIIATFKVQDDVHAAETNIVAFTPATPAEPVVEGMKFTGWEPEIKEISASTEFVAQLEPIASGITINVTLGTGIASVTVDDQKITESGEVKLDKAGEVTITLEAASTFTIPVFMVSRAEVGAQATPKTKTYTVADGDTFTFTVEEAKADDPQVDETQKKQAIIDAIDGEAGEEDHDAAVAKVNQVVTTEETPAVGKVTATELAKWITENSIPSAELGKSDYVVASVKLGTDTLINKDTDVKVEKAEEATGNLEFAIKVAGKDVTSIDQVENFVELSGDLGDSEAWKTLPQSELQSAVKIEDGKLVITPVTGIDKLFLKVNIPQDAK